MAWCISSVSFSQILLFKFFKRGELLLACAIVGLWIVVIVRGGLRMVWCAMRHCRLWQLKVLLLILSFRWRCISSDQVYHTWLSIGMMLIQRCSAILQGFSRFIGLFRACARKFRQLAFEFTVCIHFCNQIIYFMCFFSLLDFSIYVGKVWRGFFSRNLWSCTPLDHIWCFFRESQWIMWLLYVRVFIVDYRVLIVTESFQLIWLPAWWDIRAAYSSVYLRLLSKRWWLYVVIAQNWACSW